MEIYIKEINQKSFKDIKNKNVINCFKYLENLGLGNIREEKDGKSYKRIID